MSGIMMNVIHGAVNTLIICWAESPEIFEDNHKDWARQMSEVWASAFPGTQIQEAARNHAPANVASPNPGRYGATMVAVYS